MRDPLTDAFVAGFMRNKTDEQMLDLVNTYILCRLTGPQKRKLLALIQSQVEGAKVGRA